jgi:hypothetical protein
LGAIWVMETVERFGVVFDDISILFWVFDDNTVML